MEDLSKLLVEHEDRDGDSATWNLPQNEGDVGQKARANQPDHSKECPRVQKDLKFE